MRHPGWVDVPLVLFGSCIGLVAAVLAFLGVTYQPETTPLIPAQPREVSVAVKLFAVAGALVVGLGAFGFGGLALAAVLCVAFRVART